MFETHPLDGPFGVEIVGIDLNEVDDALMRQLAATLYEHRVICIRGQSLSKQRYLEFGRQWGEPIPHVLDHMRMQGFPEMKTVGNTEKRDEDPKIRNGAALWHTDQSYEAVPASATMLYSLRAPSSGGETQFCNMAEAYESLPADLRPQADRLNVAHKYGMGIRGPDEPPANPIINDKQDSQVPAVYHPAVMTHPIAGHRALYALGHGAHGAEGMDDEQAMPLLYALREHAIDDQHVYKHKYKVGDVVVWDTFQTMHRATPIDVATTDEDSRLLWRISVRGTPRVYQQHAR